MKTAPVNLLALFLGCEAESLAHEATQDHKGILSGVTIMGPGLYSVELRRADGSSFMTRGEQVILCLRRLESITEGEARHIAELDSPDEIIEPSDFINLGYGPTRPVFDYIKRDVEAYREALTLHIGTPEIWAYLLSLGFDLFDWIGQGMAIEKTA